MATLDIKVAASADDCSDYGASTFALFNNPITLGLATIQYSGGFRFLGITIPAGATIDTAYITFTGYNNQSADTVRLGIWGENSATPATFSTDADFAARVKTTAKVDWDFTTDFVTDGTYNSAELKTIVQELVDDYNGLSSYNMVFLVLEDGSTDGAYRNIISYDGSATKCANLHIEYHMAYTLFPSDSLAIVDSHVMNVGINRTDTITIADILDFLKTITLYLSDNIAIADSFSKTSEFKRSMSDLVALTDTLTRAVEFNRSIADSVAIADMISKEFRLPKSDAIVIADALTKAVGLNKVDTVTIADLFAKVSAFAPALTDTVSINDAISKAVAVVKADVIAISEGLQRIIGSANVSVDDTVGIDFFRLSKFTAEGSGDVVQIRIYSEGSLNVKVAMYEDNAGEPGDLMNAVNISQAVVTGWNLLTFPATAVVLGTDYWLAFNSG